MKTSRFKPLEDSQPFDFHNVTPVTREKQYRVTDKNEENHNVESVVTHVTPVTRKKQYKLSADDAYPAGGGIASEDDFRDAECQDITYEDVGMTKCYRCGYAEALGKSEPSGKRVIRCRHPDLHGGRWVMLCGDRWRRCSHGFVRHVFA